MADKGILLRTLNEAPGSGPLPDNYQTYVEDPTGKSYRSPVGRVRGAGGGGGGTLTARLTVSLAAGRLAGIQNGDDFQVGSPIEALLRKLLVETIYPTYATASVGVSQSAPADGEVGESVPNTITGTFYPGEAGPLTAMREYRGNQAQIGASDTASPIVRTTQMVRSLTPTPIWAVADYAAGAKKLVTPGNTPDSRPAQVRNPNAPQAAETGLSSPVIYFNGHLNVFFGATATTPTDSDTTRALPQKQLTSAGNQGILTTGTTATQFAIALPPGYRLLSVFDLDNQGANITSAYAAQDGLSVKDAGGTPRDYFLYLYRAAGPYPVSARHQFTYGT